MEYRDDEIAFLFPSCARGSVKVPYDETHTVSISARYEPAHEIHHILNNPRWDRTWNLVALGPHTHRFAHKWIHDATVLCIMSKILKGEWNWDEACECDQKDVAGWLSIQTLRWEWIEPYRKLVLEHRERNTA